MTSLWGNPWENSKWTAFLPISNYRSLEKCQRKKKNLDHMCLCERKIRKCEKKHSHWLERGSFLFAKKNHTNNSSRKYMEHPWFYDFSGFNFTWSATNFLAPIDVNEFPWWTYAVQWTSVNQQAKKINVDVNISLTEYFLQSTSFWNWGAHSCGLVYASDILNIYFYFS